MQSKDRYFVPSYQSIHDIPKDIENIYFYRYGNKEDFTVLDFSLLKLTQLRSITIGSNSYKNVREFVLDGLEELVSVKIEGHSFRISDRECKDNSICSIRNCPNLFELEIGRESFVDFQRFELSNVKILQSIRFGSKSFQYAEQCILKGEY